MQRFFAGAKLIEPIVRVKHYGFADPIWRLGESCKTTKASALFVDDLYSIAARMVPHSSHSSEVTRLFKCLLVSCSKVARSLEIPVWIIHRTKAALAQKSHQYILGVHDASECKNFGQYVDTAIMIGNHANSGCFKISCAKPVYGDQPNNVIAKFNSSHHMIQATPDERKLFETPKWKRSQTNASEGFLQFLEDRRQSPLRPIQID